MNSTAWYQANVTFPRWERAETVALTHITPIMINAEENGAVTAWFIIRKRPCWRLRYLSSAHGQDHISRCLDRLIADGHIDAWTRIVYEPEIHAFGGVEAMASAHQLFHHDSRSLISFLQRDAGRHRRETSLILCSLMMGSAELDWYEQGDVWARVSAHRTPHTLPETDGRDRLHVAVKRLLSVNGEQVVRPGGPLAHAAGWADAYTQTGRELAHLNNSGQLNRGLRDVLAHHVIFAWNRAGLPYTTQATLAATAKTVIFGPDPASERSTTAGVETH